MNLPITLLLGSGELAKKPTLIFGSGVTWSNVTDLPFPAKPIDAAKLLGYPAKEFVGFKAKFYRTKRLRDFPFSYGELPNQSIIFLSMSGIPGALPFAEQPYERRHYKKAPEKYRTDFWASCQNMVFLMEYRHKVMFLKKKGNTDQLHPFYANDANAVKDKWKALKNKVETSTEVFLNGWVACEAGGAGCNFIRLKPWR